MKTHTTSIHPRFVPISFSLLACSKLQVNVKKVEKVLFFWFRRKFHRTFLFLTFHCETLLNILGKYDKLWIESKCAFLWQQMIRVEQRNWVERGNGLFKNSIKLRCFCFSCYTIGALQLCSKWKNLRKGISFLSSEREGMLRAWTHVNTRNVWHQFLIKREFLCLHWQG